MNNYYINQRDIGTLIFIVTYLPTYEGKNILLKKRHCQ